MTEQPALLPIMQGLHLHHPETGILFQRSMRIAPEEVAALLALPHDTLAADLRAILKHAEERFDLYKQEEEANEWQWETMGAPLHAVMLLSELPGRENLDAVLGFCAMQDEPLQFHLSDLLTEMMWEPIAKLAVGQFGLMAEFVRTPCPDVFARVTAAEAMNRIADTWPEQQPAVAQWYGEQLAHFAGLADDDPALDVTLVAAMVADCLDQGLKELMPVIEDLFGKWRVDPGYCGDLEKVRQEFIAPHYPARREAVRPLAGLYAKMQHIEQVFNARKAEEKEQDQLRAQARLLNQDYATRMAPMASASHKEKKVGRNDPCTCGSGKKYKKCCGG